MAIANRAKYEIDGVNCNLLGISRNIFLCDLNIAQNRYWQDPAAERCQGQPYKIETDRYTGPFDVVRPGN